MTLHHEPRWVLLLGLILIRENLQQVTGCTP